MKTQDGKYELPVVYLDIETNELASEVGGWNHVDKMTLGVGVTYDERDELWRFWNQKNVLGLCEFLSKAPLIVAHNGFRFDLTVLWGYLRSLDSIPIPLIEMRDEKPEYHKNGWAGIPVIDTLTTLRAETGRFIALENLAMSTVNMEKAEGIDGGQAPILLREGRVREVNAYCRQDVQMLRKVFEYGVGKGVVWYLDTRTRKPRFARPDWAARFSSLARVRGSRVK